MGSRSISARSRSRRSRSTSRRPARTATSGLFPRGSQQRPPSRRKAILISKSADQGRRFGATIGSAGFEERTLGRCHTGRAIRSKSTGSVHLARLLGRYALPPQQEREPRSEDGSTSSVARLGIVSTYASLQAANGVDLYKALGITSQASLPEIKVAFRQLAKALHPDRNAGDKLAEQQFAAVREAYSILVNAEWRAIYDREIELIRAAAAAQAAEQETRRTTARRRLVLHEALKFAAATVILTAAFVTGVSIWQRSSQRSQTVETGTEPPRAHV